MKYWRMAFSMGNQGPSLWSLCLKYGIAAISYNKIDRYDLSNYILVEISKINAWHKLKGSSQPSLRKFRYEMNFGDIIYVKHGIKIVGKGIVNSDYEYEICDEIIDNTGHLWPHQRNIIWNPSFSPIIFPFKNAQHTVLELDISTAEKIDRKSIMVSRNESKLNVKEGEIQEAMIKFRKRNRAIIEAKKDAMKDNYKCEICRFSYIKTFGKSIRECLEVHHKNPLYEIKKKVVTNINDLLLICPNCHRAIHTKKPPLTPDRLKKLLK